MTYPENFFEWIDFWLEFYKKPTVKLVTYQSCDYNSRTLKKYASNIPLKEIDEYFCQLVLNKMYDNGYAKATMNKIYRIMKQSLWRAKRCGCISDNPTEFLSIPSGYTKNIEALTTEQQTLVELACKKEKLGYLFLFMLHTGLSEWLAILSGAILFPSICASVC